MTQFDIGQTITCEHRGQHVTGRIVGIEPSNYRRGYPAHGYVALVQPAEGEAFEVYLPAQEQER
jgi:hypothetical protein